ncbi:MAG TPA: hypothetical protein VFN60_01840 [Acidimicrobiales bacterium]|nr:hypothetical protein [Acidimicrobiales bacterium]
MPTTGAVGSAVAACGPAATAAVLAVAAWAVGLRGTDTAAQVYRAALAGSHGLVLWDPGWYTGAYPLAYSVLAPPLVAFAGAGLSGVLAAAGATAAFDATVRRLTGRVRPWGVWYFALSTLIAVGVGQLTYLCGEAAGLLALWVALSRRPGPAPVIGAAVLGTCAALLSPLAAAFAVLAAGVLLAGRAAPPAPLVALGGTAAATVGILGLGLFPGDGPFPFAWTGLVVVEGLCLAVVAGGDRLLGLPPLVRAGAAAYGLATLASFLVPNPLGGNAPRLAESVGLPLVLCGLPRRGGRRDRRSLVAVAVLAPFAVWQWGPTTAFATRSSEPPSDHAAFYRPLGAELAVLTHRRPVRVEVVPTRDHAESADVPSATVSLARGWERQLDVGRNPLFYRRGALTDHRYLRWLRHHGVAYVALPLAPLDYAGRGEAALLRAGVPGLAPVWSTPAWRLWRVTGSPGLTTGPARVAALGADRVVLDARGAGTVLVRVHWTPYFTLTAGRACLAPGPGGWTLLHTRGPDRVALGVSLIGGRRARCRP